MQRNRKTGPDNAAMVSHHSLSIKEQVVFLTSSCARPQRRELQLTPLTDEEAAGLKKTDAFRCCGSGRKTETTFNYEKDLRASTWLTSTVLNIIYFYKSDTGLTANSSGSQLGPETLHDTVLRSGK